MNDNLNQLSEIDFLSLVSFIREQIREDKMLINRETLIEDQLGVTGDEAEELIIAFAKQYNVNIDNFIFRNYFYDEPGLFNIPNRVIKPLNIGHLERAIIAGALDDNVIK